MRAYYLYKMGRLRVLLRAPQNGCVVDHNIYTSDDSAVDKLRESLIDSGILNEETFKCHVPAFQVEQKGSACKVKIYYAGISVILEDSCLETTLGGCAYNIYQDLRSLDKAIAKFMDLQPVIMVPGRFLKPPWLEGSPRESLMIVREKKQPLNIVTMPKSLPLAGFEDRRSDVAVLTSYTPEEAQEEAAFIRCAPHLRLYLNPGSTQIRQGAASYADVLQRCECVSMQAKEAAAFFKLGGYSSTDLLSAFTNYRLRRAIFTASEEGADFFADSFFHHEPVFPEEPVRKLLNSYRHMMGWPRHWTVAHRNYSGCGDSVTAAFIYGHEQKNLNDRQKVRLGMAFARLISLLPNSHLEGVPNGLIMELYKMGIN